VRDVLEISEQRARDLLAGLLNAAVITDLHNASVFPTDHPLHVGGIGQGGTAESEQLFKQADAVLIIGANWWPASFVPRQTQVVKIDIDPQNIDAHPQVTYGLVGDAAQVTRELLQQVQNRKQHLPIVKSDWLATVQNSKARSDEQSMQERLAGRFAENAEDVNGGLATEAVTPRQVMHALDERVDHDAIIVLDTGDHTLWFNSDFRAKSQDVLYSGKWRTMGYGLPAAIAAKMVYPDKQVVAIVGDGGLAMTMMEWATAVRFNVPVIVVVMNNHSLAMEEHKMMAEGYTPFGVSLTNPDFAMLARSFGVSGEQISSESALIGALERHLHSDKPVCLDVRTEKVMPPLTGK
jgi:pyruvate oxidase